MALLALADQLSAAYAALIAERAALAGAATEAQGARALFSAQTLRRGEVEFDNAMRVLPPLSLCFTRSGGALASLNLALLPYQHPRSCSVSQLVRQVQNNGGCHGLP